VRPGREECLSDPCAPGVQPEESGGDVRWARKDSEDPIRGKETSSIKDRRSKKMVRGGGGYRVSETAKAKEKYLGLRGKGQGKKEAGIGGVRKVTPKRDYTKRSGSLTGGGEGS